MWHFSTVRWLPQVTKGKKRQKKKEINDVATNTEEEGEEIHVNIEAQALKWTEEGTRAHVLCSNKTHLALLCPVTQNGSSYP